MASLAQPFSTPSVSIAKHGAPSTREPLDAFFPTAPAVSSPPLPNQAFAQHVQQRRLQEYFPLALLLQLSPSATAEIFDLMQYKPLSLVIINHYELGRISYAQYCELLARYRPGEQALSQQYVEHLNAFVQHACRLYRSGYVLTGADSAEPNPAIRSILAETLHSLGIKFVSAQSPKYLPRLHWPYPKQVAQRLHTEFLKLGGSSSTAPTQPLSDLSHLPPDQRPVLEQFECILARALGGAYRLELNCTRNYSDLTARFAVFVEWTQKYNMCIVDAAHAAPLGALLEHASNSRHIYLSNVHLMPAFALLAFVTGLNNSAADSLAPAAPRTLILGHPGNFDNDIISVLKLTVAGTLQLNTAALPSTYTPEFQPNLGFANPAYHQRRYFSARAGAIVRDSYASINWAAGPVHWLSVGYLGYALELYRRCRSDAAGSGVVVLTETQAEADALWPQLRGNGDTALQIGTICTYCVDFARPLCRVDDIDAVEGTATLSDWWTKTALGTGFELRVLEQMECVPWTRYSTCLNQIVFFYSTAHIGYRRLTQLCAMAQRALIIISPLDSIRKLLN